MMVPSLEAQAGVMVEYVQNHTVETLIVDEIGRKAEVLAASTVRQRGPRLIASAHGDFRALIKNPDLKGLVGGSQQVTIGDKEAKSLNKGKLQTQRAGNPIRSLVSRKRACWRKASFSWFGPPLKHVKELQRRLKIFRAELTTRCFERSGSDWYEPVTM
ncbi:hypothetical protein PInf_025557 [Phytophthora infestans]|nr:hypothetical protein PInf_025557 [Phytophthora infestans]